MILTSEQIKGMIQSIESPTAEFTEKSVNYYDGKQLEPLAKLLDDPQRGRANWKERGFNLIYRNLTKMVIDKSSMLYKDGMPQIEIYQGDTVDERQTQAFMDYADKSMLNEFMINLDPIIRLLKSVGVLISYNSETDNFSYGILHQGNSKMLFLGNMIVAVLFEVSEGDGYCYYQSITDEVIQDWRVQEYGNAVEHMGTIPNPYGFVPVAMFHDTNVPKDGMFNVMQKDLVTFNEIYNLYLIDMLFASSYSFRKTLFTNASFEDDDIPQSTGVQETVGSAGDKLGRNVSAGSPQTIIGPDRAIQVSTRGGEAPFVQYLGPDVSIQEVKELLMDLTKDFAADWSVRVRADGYGNVTSGFQIVVEEIDNLELRSQRSRMAEAGLSRLFDNMNMMLQTVLVVPPFSIDAQLYATFTAPMLPINKKEELDIWAKKIELGLATKEDYWRVVDKMTEDEIVARKAAQQVDGVQP